MYTQCRGCGEVFVIEVDHLTHARGQVRCNLCGTVFDGMETLSAEKPHEDEDLLLHDFDNAPPLLTQAYLTFPSENMLDEDEAEAEADLEITEWDDSSSWSMDEMAYEASEQVADIEDQDVAVDFNTSDDNMTVPGFITDDETLSEVPFVAEKRQQEQQPSNQRWMWAGMSVLMLGGLLWQAQKAIASGKIQLPEHPISEQVCTMVNCVGPAEAVDLNSISLVSRNIRPHPGLDDALIITASMINANKNNQKFPALEIKLSDLNGQIVAMRRFVAKEYVPAEVMRAGFVPNMLIPINLEIASPGDNAVAFEIGFAQP